MLSNEMVYRNLKFTLVLTKAEYRYVEYIVCRALYRNNRLLNVVIDQSELSI